jgi:heme-degrading monooxygenase HmoA
MIVVTNRIPVAEGHEIDFEDRFRKRVHLVDQSPASSATRCIARAP